MKDIFSIRLKKARTMAGLSMDALVEKMGDVVKKNSISKYERGEMLPTSKVLIKLANALCVTPDYFFRPFTIEVSSFDFRKKASLRVKDVNKIKGEVSDYIERYVELEQIVNESNVFINPVSNINILGFEDVEIAAKSIREIWNLGESSINSVVELLEYNNIKVIEIDAPIQFDGLSAYINNEFPVVVLNKSFSPERKRFTALHELGHLILNIGDDVEPKLVENYCNRLAGSMLIPKSIVDKTIGVKRHRISVYELEDLQRRFGISIDALMHRLLDLRIITANNYKFFHIKKNTDKKLKIYIETDRCVNIEVSNRFETLLAKSLSEELLTYSKAAALGMRSVEELKNSIIIA